MPSSAKFRCGLVVGKFAPLHHGHVLLIERAIAGSEQVIVISYTVPEFSGCERTARDGWIRELFPGVTALVIDQEELDRHCCRLGIARQRIPHNDEPAGTHREFVGWLCWSVLGSTVNAVFTSEDYGDGFAAALSAYFASRGPMVPVAHVCVDRKRVQVPVSGTLARADIHAAQAWLPAAVYGCFIGRVAILGAESSGKTTLARALAKRFNTAWVPEYGRERWVARGGALDFDDLLHIGRTQVERERAASSAAYRWIFCDTTPFSTVFYSQDGYGRTDPELAALARRPYDHVFLCAPDFSFVQDGTRAGAAFSRRQHEWHIEQLGRDGNPYQLVQGSLAERLRQVSCALAAAPRRRLSVHIDDEQASAIPGTVRTNTIAKQVDPPGE